MRPDTDTVRALLRRAESVLLAGPHPDRARADAELLLRNALNRDKAWLIAHADDPVPSDSGALFEQWLRRRCNGEPVQYILGEAEFFGLALTVDPAVLIPRPETEVLVEHVLDFLRGREHPRILDVGTGSGAIAVALAVARQDAQLTAVDLSDVALRVAAANAARHGVVDRITFVQSDLFSALADERFDCIVSNPPYVARQEQATLTVEVRDHEPALALFADNEGLAIYQRLIPAARAHLAPSGMIALEIGFGQHSSVSALLAAADFHPIETLTDYQQIPRVLSARNIFPLRAEAATSCN